MHDYFFYELHTNFLIPGDWEWYVETYAQHHEFKAGRPGWRFGLNTLDLRVEEIPQQVRPFTLSCAAFCPQNAMRYHGRRVPAPSGVVEGAATCAKREFVEQIGLEVVRRNCLPGNILLPDGSAVAGWRPLIPRIHIRVDLSDWENLSAYVAQLSGHELYGSTRFVLVLRDDVFFRVRNFNPRGCRIVQWSASSRKFTVLRKSKPPGEVGARERKKAERDPFIRHVMESWKAAAKGKAGDGAVSAIDDATKKLKRRKTAPDRKG